MVLLLFIYLWYLYSWTFLCRYSYGSHLIKISSDNSQIAYKSEVKQAFVGFLCILSRVW